MNNKFDLDSIVENKLDELQQYGYIRGGHNGPYYDSETPVRNTAHHIIIFKYYYYKKKEKKYYDAIIKCADYLLTKEVRPLDSVFYCRTNKNKDLSNGVIGQAWAIEGLVEAFKVTKDKRYIDLAVKVFLMIPFDKYYKLWKTLNVDGSIRGFDMTFNHQLWFVTAGIQILSTYEDNEIRSRCNLFLDSINQHINTYKNGLIKHPQELKKSKNGIKNFVKKIYKLTKKRNLTKKLYYKENGYHLFNVYAFALIKNHGVDLDFFKSDKFTRILQYCFSENLYEWLLEKEIKFDGNSMPHVKNDRVNIYGFPYNSPGFELPYIYKTFGDLVGGKDQFIDNIIDKQIEITYCNEKKRFNMNNEDLRTMEARLYEYIRVFDLE